MQVLCCQAALLDLNLFQTATRHNSDLSKSSAQPPVVALIQQIIALLLHKKKSPISVAVNWNT